MASTIFRIFAILNWLIIDTQCDLYGKWPIHGGNLENQKSIPSSLTLNNIHSLQTNCIYISNNGQSRVGYITIDDDNNGYLSDRSGFITKVDLDDCSATWRINIAEILGYNSSNIYIRARNSVTLFTNTNGQKGLLFGTGPLTETVIDEEISSNCFAVALLISDATLLWKKVIPKASNCNLHTLIVDNNFAYGGVSSYANRIGEMELFRGKMLKLDVNTGEIINIWHPFPDYIVNGNSSDWNNTYSGIGIWGVVSIIDEYLVFGTGNLYSYPDTIADCLLNNNSSNLFETYSTNPCGEDKSNIKWWNCLETNIFTDSFIVLNKTTFDEIITLPLYGVGCYVNGCTQIFGNSEQIKLGCPVVAGPDADVTSIATYKQNGSIYAVVHQKSGQLYIIEIPSGNVILSKKMGGWSRDGGAPNWGVALDPQLGILVTANTGGRPYDDNRQNEYTSKPYKYFASDGQTIVCDTGMIYGIDLKSGNVLYNIINPYGHMNEECNNVIYDEYVDIAAEGTCERNLLPGYSSTDTVNIVVPKKDLFVPPNANRSALFRSTATISNDLLFIASVTGDIFVHNVYDGTYIKTISCPSFVDSNGVKRRGGIQNGITVVDDRIVYYCGMANHGLSFDLDGDMMISMKLSSKDNNNLKVWLISIFGGLLLIVVIVVFIVILRRNHRCKKTVGYENIDAL
eukprot:444234_1